MGKRPAFQFYTGDWLKDPDLGQCTPETRGVWIDMLALMHENGQTGILEGTTEGIARICRCTVMELGRAINELRISKTATVTQSNGVYKICNRRMYREHLDRKSNAERQKRYRDKTNNVESNVKITLPSSTSSSSSTSNTIHKEFLEAWNSHPFTKCRKLTTGRKKALSARLKDKDWSASWRKAMDKLAALPGATGTNERNWVATIDFFLRPDTVTKIIEGAYDSIWGVEDKQPPKDISRFTDADYEDLPEGMKKYGE